MKFCPILQVSNSIHSGNVLKKGTTYSLFSEKVAYQSFFFLKKKLKEGNQHKKNKKLLEKNSAKLEEELAAAILATLI